MMKLDGIATFVAVAETGSISETARRLRLSKSVVSDRLTELERSLGANLVHRSTRRLTLTEDGIAFLERASRITHEVEEAAADMAERRGDLIGPLRISAPVTFGRMHLGPALYPFIAKHPGIELTLDLDDRRADASAGGYDAVVRHGPIADSRLMAWRLAASRRVLVASPDYLAQYGTPGAMADLSGHRGIHQPGCRRLALPGFERRNDRARAGRTAGQQWRHDARRGPCRARYRVAADVYRRR